MSYNTQKDFHPLSLFMSDQGKPGAWQATYHPSSGCVGLLPLDAFSVVASGGAGGLGDMYICCSVSFEKHY